MKSQDSISERKRKLFGAGAILLLLLVTAVSPTTVHGAAKTSGNPYETAVDHAELAVKANTLDGIHMHLHHVLNCLEGDNGKDFDAAAGNPCNGRGALETLKKGTADWIRATNSIALSRVGVKLHDEKPAHYVAEAVLAILSESNH